MELNQATTNQVVRNVKNGSHYRVDRPEKSRIRIRPLELFPTGLLVPKPTDTLVAPDIAVLLVGIWFEGMRVEGRPSATAEAYERELAERRAQLVQLMEGYEALPINGKGVQSRGSWANKINNCRARIEVLEQGLATPEPRAKVLKVRDSGPGFGRGSHVLLPSGRVGQVMSLDSRRQMVKVTATHLGASYCTDVPHSAVQPVGHAFRTHAAA